MQHDDADGFEKRAVIAASPGRVWEAIVDSSQFGEWFGAEFDSAFVVGETVEGQIVPTTVDSEVAAAQEPYRGSPMTIAVDEITEPTRFAFRWNPSPETDAQTTVIFTLTPIDTGVELAISESGFDSLPDGI